MKKVISSIFLCIFFFFLLLYPKETVKSAAEGLSLWLNTLVPTLLPIMILSNLLILTGLSAKIAYIFHPLCHRLFATDIHGTYALISGFLCGFPMGAKAVSDLYEKKLISKEDAQYLCVFCNNVSPAFIINYLYTQNMSPDTTLSSVFCILYGAPLIYGLFMRHKYGLTKTSAVLSANKASFTAPNFAMIDACITNGIHSITKLGGYIILFSISAAILNLLPDTCPFIKTLLIALTEISTGIPLITTISVSSEIACTLLMICTAFGGLCTAVQSHSMLHSINMSLQQYLRARLCIAAIAAVLSVCYFF